MERIVESYRNGEGGVVQAADAQPQSQIPSSFAVARSFDSQACWSGFATWRWQGRRSRQRHIRAKKEQNISTRFEGYGAKDVDTISKAKAIPSIEEVLAQLDQEDEDELLY